MAAVQMKRVAIVQPNYIPWKGYFDLINLVDEFILFDDVQYTRRDWRNRNRIKTADGIKWLTIPVETKGLYDQLIRDARVSDSDWKRRHWRTIRASYGRAAHFTDYEDFFADLFLSCEEEKLHRVNHRFLASICELLGIETPLHSSSDFEVSGAKSERLLALCRKAGATHYLSGPAARDYLKVDTFEQAGVTVEWMDYSDYPEYRQLHPPFEHGVSIIDLIFNEGPRATAFMKSFEEG